MKNKISKLSFVLAIFMFAISFLSYFSIYFTHRFSRADMTSWEKVDSFGEGFNPENGLRDDDNKLIKIYTAPQLAYYMQTTRNTNNGLYNDYNIKLMNNLDMNGNKYYWTPIENFNKTFDGNGHIIKNLNISTSTHSVGLFGTIQDGATIKNLIIQNVTISQIGKKNSVFVGGIVGNTAGKSKLQNCTVSNFNSSSPFITNNPQYLYIGGIAGRVDSNTEISNCMVMNSNISLEGIPKSTTSWTAIGGIVGETNNAKISQCASQVDIGEVNYSASICCGGIVGMAYTTRILECYYTQKNNGINIGIDANSTVVNRADIGGIAGSISGATIENCYSVGGFEGYVNKEFKPTYTIKEDLFSGYIDKILSATAYSSTITTGNFNELCFYEYPYGTSYHTGPKGITYEESTGKSEIVRVDVRVEFNINHKPTDLGDCNYTLLSPLKISGNMLFIGGVVGYISSSGNKINSSYSRVLNNFSHKITKEYNYYTKVRADTCGWVNKGEKWLQYNPLNGKFEEVVCTQAGYTYSFADYKFAACQTVTVQAETVGDIYGFNASNEDILTNCYVIREKNYGLTFDSYNQKYYWSINENGDPQEITQYGKPSPMRIESLNSYRYNDPENDGKELGSPMLKNEDAYNHDSRCNWWYLNELDKQNYRICWGVDFEKSDNFCYIKPFCMAYDEYNQPWTRIWNYYDSKCNFAKLKVDANTNALTLQATIINHNSCGNLDKNKWAVNSKINGGYPHLKCFYWQYQTSKPTIMTQNYL